jgi:hypothetical protein
MRRSGVRIPAPAQVVNDATCLVSQPPDRGLPFAERPDHMLCGPPVARFEGDLAVWSPEGTSPTGLKVEPPVKPGLQWE